MSSNGVNQAGDCVNTVIQALLMGLLIYCKCFCQCFVSLKVELKIDDVTVLMLILIVAEINNLS